MEDEKLGQDCAFPIMHSDGDHYLGMSKRLYIATQIMSGMLANKDLNRFGTNGGDHFDVVKQAYKFADNILEQE